MKPANIHPTAIIEPGATIGNHVTIEAYAIIKSTVTLKDYVTIRSHAYIDGYTTIGESTTVYPSACIGTKSQDLKFRGEKTYVTIGKHCEIREFVTINASCQENSVVSVGDHCLIMAYCHIAHNCSVGNHVIMSNNATLAGHINVEDYAIIGGLTPIHQFVNIGTHAMVGGLSRITHDIPPYTIGAGIPFKFGGINVIGLKRHGFPIHVRTALSKAFKLMYRNKLTIAEAVLRIEQEIEPLKEILHLIKFCKGTKRGLMCLQAINDETDEDEIFEEETICAATKN